MLGKRAWLWMVATALVAVFRIAQSRSGKVARALLGESFAGFLVSDRWSGYEWYDAGLRQLCWAHLTRDFQGFIDRGGKGGRLGRKLMRQRKTSFGTQGPEGSRFVERILTAVTTLKLQRRGALDFMTNTLHAHRHGLPAPSLLPTPETLQLVNAA